MKADCRTGKEAFACRGSIHIGRDDDAWRAFGKFQDIQLLVYVAAPHHPIQGLWHVVTDTRNSRSQEAVVVCGFIQ